MTVARSTRVTGLLTAAVAAMTLITPGPARAGTDQGAPAMQRWDARSGWVEVPAPPASAPSAAWTETFDAYDLQQDVLVAGRVTEAGFAISRLDPATGRELWRFNVENADVVADLWDVEVSADGRLAIVNGDGAGGESVVLDATDGSQVWKGRFRVTDGRVDGDVALLTHLYGAYAIEMSTGAERWRYESDGLDSLSITLSDGQLLLTVPETVVGVLDPATGELRWRQDWGTGEAHVVDSVVLPVYDESVLGLDAATGEVQFDIDIAGFQAFGAVPGGDDVAVLFGERGAEQPVAEAIDPVTGQSVWSIELPDDMPFGIWHDDAPPVETYRVDGDVLVVADAADAVIVIDGSTGDVVSRQDHAGRGYLRRGIVFEDTGGQVIARSIPGLTELWRIDQPADAFLQPVTNGLVAIGYDATEDDYVLTGYTA